MRYYDLFEILCHSVTVFGDTANGIAGQYMLNDFTIYFRSYVKVKDLSGFFFSLLILPTFSTITIIKLLRFELTH